MYASARSGVPMASSMSSARLGAPPWSGPESAPMAATIAAAEVGTGRGHDPGGERRGVEAVIDRQDHVLLDRPGMGGRRLLARQHVEVVGGEAEVVPGLDRVVPLPQSMGGGQDGRHHRAEPERLLVQLVRADVVGGPPTELGAEQRDRGAQHIERGAETGQRRAAVRPDPAAWPSGAARPRQRRPMRGRPGARPGTADTRRLRGSAARPTRTAEYWR